MSKVLITGVSSGIGEALAQLYLSEGHEVYGISRRPPYSILKNNDFHFMGFDLSRLAEFNVLLDAGLGVLLKEGIDIFILNAGISGNVPGRGEEFSLEEIQHVISVNVLANKLLLDLMLASEKLPKICMVSGSMAGVRYRSGTLPYSLSKAALSAMAGVYAQENPDIFFAVLGLCNVNTNLSRQVSFSAHTDRFAELKALQKRALTKNYMVSPMQRATDIYQVLGDPAKFGVVSGEFIDIRTILPEVLHD